MLFFTFKFIKLNQHFRSCSSRYSLASCYDFASWIYVQKLCCFQVDLSSLDFISKLAASYLLLDAHLSFDMTHRVTELNCIEFLRHTRDSFSFSKLSVEILCLPGICRILLVGFESYAVFDNRLQCFS